MEKYLDSIEQAKTPDQLDQITEAAAMDDTLTGAQYEAVYAAALHKAQTWDPQNRERREHRAQSSQEEEGDKMIPKNIVDIVESQGWSITDAESGVEFEAWSPAGEDFFFHVEGEDIPAEVREFADEFSPDDHAGEMYEAGKSGLSGVPPLSVLVKDAIEIKSMLERLAETLEGAGC